MPSYWWECENCSSKGVFLEICDSRGITHFIRDILLQHDWDQNYLNKKCKNCGKESMRITYLFPRKEKETLRVVHIIGLGKPGDDYIPMMWETYPLGEKEIHWFDFKYINKRNILGLNRPAVFTHDDLKKLFDLYRTKTGNNFF